MNGLQQAWDYVRIAALVYIAGLLLGAGFASAFAVADIGTGDNLTVIVGAKPQ